MEITNSNIKEVLSGIDRVHEKACRQFDSIPSEALKDAKVTDLSASDVAARVNKKPEVSNGSPEPKKPTLG